jgi:hypothetical protein
MESSQPEESHALPPFDKFVEIAAGRTLWTSAELKTRSTNADWLLTEAEAFGLLANMHEDLHLQQYELKNALRVIGEIQDAELRSAAIDCIFHFIAPRLKPVFSRLCENVQDLEPAGIRRSQLQKSLLREALPTYFPGRVFWEYVYADPTAYNEIVPKFEDVFMGTPSDISRQIDEGVVRFLNRKISSEQLQDHLRAIETEIRKSTPSRPSSASGEDAIPSICASLHRLITHFSDNQSRDTLSSVVRELRHAQFPQIKSIDGGKPIGRG